MNILFLTLVSMEDLSVRGIYTDLINELANRGINIYVVSNNVNIISGCVFGAGAVVGKDIVGAETYVVAPARRV